MLSFAFPSTPRIRFGNGELFKIPERATLWGDRVLVLTGGRSFHEGGMFDRLNQMLVRAGIRVEHETVAGEPTPERVDELAVRYRPATPGWLLAVGGGSVIDTAKALSVMLPREGSILPYLEGVGAGAVLDGRKTPLLAVPTTAGTGSEATLNAVISRVGRDGFKRSIRHPSVLPDEAVIDPELALRCPPAVTAACGMDALTQLMEAYVSTRAHALSDALCLSGLEHVFRALLPVCTVRAGDADLRASMAYGALVSGIALNSAGLGLVHGFASSVGARVAAPHGVVCGRLLAPVTRETIRLLFQAGEAGEEALAKYARLGLLAAPEGGTDRAACLHRLLDTLALYAAKLPIPALGTYGLSESDLPDVAAQTDNKNNPARLDSARRQAILREAL